jgi:hypothetical protein
MKVFTWKHFSAFALALLLSKCSVPAAGIVTNADETTLRAAMAGGGTVTFNCNGIIALSNPLAITNNTVMDDSGHSIILSGNNLVRVLTVPTGISLSLLNLTIANGNNTGTNGNSGGLGQGGGIWAAGTLNITGCFFWTNAAVGGLNAIDAFGGAIYLAGGSLNATNCDFVGNSGTGDQGIGGAGSGGAVYNAGGFVNLENCNFYQNTASGGYGNYGL